MSRDVKFVMGFLGHLLPFIATLVLVLSPCLSWGQDGGGAPGESDAIPELEGLVEAGDSKAGAAASGKETVLPTTSKKAATGPTKVLDFEAEVIEGERKTPNLFLQLEAETPNLDTVLFQRENFNDFHLLEKARKPRYRSTRGKNP